MKSTSPEKFHLIWTAAEDLMIVGHLPFLEKLASFLICGDEGSKAVVFRYSAVLCLERTGPGRWAVDWLLKPEMV